MLLRSFNNSCLRVTAQMLPRRNGHFINVLTWFCTKTTASAVNCGAIISCEILDFGQQLSACVDGIIQGKAME